MDPCSSSRYTTLRNVMVSSFFSVPSFSTDEPARVRPQVLGALHKPRLSRALSALGDPARGRHEAFSVQQVGGDTFKKPCRAWD